MRFFITLIFLLTFIVSADDHEQPKFEGLLSSEVFDLDGHQEFAFQIVDQLAKFEARRKEEIRDAHYAALREIVQV